MIYILASQRNGTLYIGVTSNLIQRIWQHREGVVEGFAQQHGVKTLVWFEQHETMEGAIAREKALKKWNRDWKLRLIEKCNPQWLDLWPETIGQAPSYKRHPTASPTTPHPTASSPSASIGNPVSLPSFPNVLVGNPAESTPLSSSSAFVGDTEQAPLS